MLMVDGIINYLLPLLLSRCADLHNTIIIILHDIVLYHIYLLAYYYIQKFQIHIHYTLGVYYILMMKS